MLLIQCNSAFIDERRYIFHVILNVFLGLEYELEVVDRTDVRLTLPGSADNRELVVDDSFFSMIPEKWLQPDSLPISELHKWRLTEDDIDLPKLPSILLVIYGTEFSNGAFLRTSTRRIEIGIDIFGASFFMLTRYEEIVKGDKDNHDRFPMNASLAYREDFVDLPIVNVYTDLLWNAISRLWPRLVRKDREFTVNISHDVDNLLCYTWSTPLALARSLAGDIIRRRSVRTAARRLCVLAFLETGVWKFTSEGYSERIFRMDPCANLDWIMDVEESHDIRSTFNFIAERTAGRLDGAYSIDWKWVQKILVQINKRGHELGLHASYNSFQDAQKTKRELEKLRNICAKMDIEQSEWGGRQHYLRWQNPITWQNWEDAGLQYDSTLAFAEKPGFRCGVCYEYPVYDLQTRKMLKLIEKPLLIMDASVFDYMQGSFHTLSQETKRFADIVRQFSGELTLLFHNCRLTSEEARIGYGDLLDQICNY